jgi:hypothetical protein
MLWVHSKLSLMCEDTPQGQPALDGVPTMHNRKIEQQSEIHPCIGPGQGCFKNPGLLIRYGSTYPHSPHAPYASYCYSKAVCNLPAGQKI